jgi:hypothetical protein
MGSIRNGQTKSIDVSVCNQVIFMIRSSASTTYPAQRVERRSHDHAGQEERQNLFDPRQIEGRRHLRAREQQA